MKEYRFKINGNEYNVIINSIDGQTADVTVNGVSYNVGLDSPAAPAAQAPAPAPVTAVPAAQAAPAANAASPSAPAPKAPEGGKTVTSPLPGVVVEVSVKEGQAVSKGQKVAVLEAMKMENDILAACDGTVTAVHVSKGDSILEGADIVTIA